MELYLTHLLLCGNLQALNLHCEVVPLGLYLMIHLLLLHNALLELGNQQAIMFQRCLILFHLKILRINLQMHRLYLLIPLIERQLLLLQLLLPLLVI